MTRTLKEATVRRYHYDTHHALRAHLRTFLDAYNFARRPQDRQWRHAIPSSPSRGKVDVRAAPLLRKSRPPHPDHPADASDISPASTNFTAIRRTRDTSSPA